MKRLYLVQCNTKYGDNIYPPYSVGLCWSYAKTFPEIASSYEMCGFLYLKEPIPDAVAKLDNPDIIGVALYIWNEQWSKAFIRAVKEKYPACTVLVGGVSVWDESPRTLAENPDYDFAIYGEGEGAFADFLREHSKEEPDYSKCGSLIWRAYKETERVDRDNAFFEWKPPIIVNKRRPFTDLKEIPSPYLDGSFDAILQKEGRIQALLETHRGCIAENMKVITKNGEKPIELIEDGEEVLGWDGGCAWNRIGRLICTGGKNVYRVEVGSEYVDATRDHPIYTKRGWKRTDQIQVGDSVLCCLWNSPQQKEMPNLWIDLCSSVENTKYSKKDTSKISTKTSLSLQDMRSFCKMGWHKTITNMLFRMHKQSKEEVASKEKKDNQKVLQMVWQEAVSKVHNVSLFSVCKDLFRSLFKSNYQDCKNRRIESSEKTRGEKEDFKDCQETVCCDIRSYESSASKWQDSLFSYSGIGTEPIREAGCVFFRQTQTPVSVCWRRSILDRSVQEWESKKSRFRSPSTKKEEASYFSSRGVLACSGYKEIPNRNGRLCQDGMESIRDLGKGFFGCENGKASSEVSWHVVTKIEERGFVKTYDLVEALPNNNFFANGILVHNCPYACTFCEWGQAALTKVRPFPEERVYAELEWLGIHNCPYVDCCDANTGILKVRDKAIVQKLVETKAKYGYPQTFRTSFAKNSNEVVWDIANVLHKAGMLKAVTLAMQSMDKDVLKVIKRKNIPYDNFTDLVKRYDDAGIPTYTELIMGLPGETLETYLNGIEQCLEAGQHFGLFCYLNCMLPNTEQAKPAYRDLHGLKTVDMLAMLSHGTPDSSEIRERQETIVETRAMPHSDWRKAYLFSKVVEVFHVQGLLQKTAIACYDKWGMKYRDFYSRLMEWLEDAAVSANPCTIAGQAYKGIQTVLDRALAGGSWDCVDPLLGDISWPPEEFAFAHICCQLERFYDEIWGFYDLRLYRDCGESIQEMWEEQRQELAGPEPGKEAEWAREVVWYNRKGYGKKLRKRQ